ncbi:hypothetical protein CC2G_006377 [Coprinopsis cinerea AmutBmut pab1-1]|nr:hypothetical protein CC2G_006377 [Coprinopsis cinerea AmutBmut pab1-1]
MNLISGFPPHSIRSARPSAPRDVINALLTMNSERHFCHSVFPQRGLTLSLECRTDDEDYGRGTHDRKTDTARQQPRLKFSSDDSIFSQKSRLKQTRPPGILEF